MYNKRYVLIHGIKEKSGSVWETKEETGKLVIDFFQNVLLINDPASIKLAGIHRLPQHPVLRNKKNCASYNHKVDKCFRQAINI